MLEQIQESLNNLVDKLAGWLNEFILVLPNIILGAIVFAIGMFLSRYVSKWVEKLVSRFSHHRSVTRVLVNIITAAFVTLVILLVLSILNLGTALQTILAGAGVVGLAVGLALQDPIINLFSGVMMSTKRAFEIGDLVETNDYFGTIAKINLRSTVIRTPQGEEILVPNKMIYQNALKNYSSSGERRVDLGCGVSYGDDLDKVKEVAVRAIEDKVKYNSEKDVEIFFDEFGGSSINFKLRFWLKSPSLKDYLSARSEAIITLTEAFDANDIMIPFPIRTLDFGIKGGEKLNEVIELKSVLSQKDREKKNGQDASPKEVHAENAN